MKLFIPSGYNPLLTPRQTEGAIKEIKDFFQMDLASELRLRRVTAPLFVKQGTGINDDLNGVERAVRFPVKDMEGTVCEIVHSLAKWKRLTLAEYHIEPGYGIYTDMNAIRADEELDNIHSLYVDQWDWERVMDEGQRTPDFLKDIVRRIYSTLLRTEYMVCEKYPSIKPVLPETIRFIHAEQLRRRFPGLSPKEREDAICKEYGAVFVIGIGCRLGDGLKHDGR
jgi:aspartate--ammonia ligase